MRRLFTSLLVVASALAISVNAAGFHILAGQCIEHEFSKRSSTSSDSPQDHHLLSPISDGDIPSLEKRQKKGGGDGPPEWHESDRWESLNLMPSSDYSCNYLQTHENKNYQSLYGLDRFFVNGFCGHILDFYKTDRNTWEVYEHGANPAWKHGECYPDVSAPMVCELNGGIMKQRCSWRRSHVCSMNIC